MEIIVIAVVAVAIVIAVWALYKRWSNTTSKAVPLPPSSSSPPGTAAASSTQMPSATAQPSIKCDHSASTVVQHMRAAADCFAAYDFPHGFLHCLEVAALDRDNQPAATMICR